MRYLKKKYLFLFLIYTSAIGSVLHAEKSFDIEKFINEYTSDPVTFANTYKEESIVLRKGVVSSIKTGDGNTDFIVYLKDPHSPSVMVRAEFPFGTIGGGNDLLVANDGLSATILKRKKHRKIKDVKPFVFSGQSISVKGLYTGVSPSEIILSQCQIVHPGWEKSKKK